MADIAAMDRAPRGWLFDPGWLYVTAGLAMCAALVLIPAQHDLEEISRLRARVDAREAWLSDRLAAHARFIEDLDGLDDDLVVRLAATQLNLVRAGEQPLLRTATPSASVTNWIDGTVPPMPPPAYPGVPSLLARLVEGQARLWLLGASVLSIFIGLLIAPARSRDEAFGSLLATPDATADDEPFDDEATLWSALAAPDARIEPDPASAPASETSPDFEPVVAGDVAQAIATVDAATATGLVVSPAGAADATLAEDPDEAPELSIAAPLEAPGDSPKRQRRDAPVIDASVRATQSDRAHRRSGASARDRDRARAREIAEPVAIACDGRITGAMAASSTSVRRAADHAIVLRSDVHAPPAIAHGRGVTLEAGRIEMSTTNDDDMRPELPASRMEDKDGDVSSTPPVDAATIAGLASVADHRVADDAGGGTGDHYGNAYGDESVMPRDVDEPLEIDYASDRDDDGARPDAPPDGAPDGAPDDNATVDLIAEDDDEASELVDEDGNPVEYEEEYEYVDEDGNPIEDEDEYEYVDEDGNPIEDDDAAEDEVEDDDKASEVVDEDGNPIEDEEEYEYVDEDGNPVEDDDEASEVVDQDGNPIEDEEEYEYVDEDEDPIEDDEEASGGVDEDGTPIEDDEDDSSGDVDEDGNPIDDEYEYEDVDEDGNSIEDEDDSSEDVDEDGNPIDDEYEYEYVDEDGNPIEDEGEDESEDGGEDEGEEEDDEYEYVDEDGNPIDDEDDEYEYVEDDDES